MLDPNYYLNKGRKALLTQRRRRRHVRGERFSVHVVAIHPVAGFVVLTHRVQIQTLVAEFTRREGLAVGARMEKFT